jgi:hypothetical protein
MNTFTHDQCGGAVDISHKPITCQKCGKVGHAVVTKDDGQNIILWSQEEYREQLNRRVESQPNGRHQN